ncbi:methylated-DNA--[protein]-cysteine S-methyltransferase [Gaopeijia maritima]|uniref:Methylated-DNA--[protein]-cysteine S-methyltransferase n=1 Tax=Gaopeijia maritima TaxID=3119007 RepID=A0ABU9E4Q7_9BACT
MFSAQLPGTPVGTVKLWATTEGLRRLDFRKGPDLALPGERISADPAPPIVREALDALKGYFRGENRALDIPLDLGAITDFQKRVFERLRAIPYGQVATYGDVARSLDLGPAGARAVGQAVGANPVAIVVPCHRVVASTGALHGYSGGLGRKAALLRIEGIEVDGAEAGSKVHPEVLRLPL